MLRLRAVVGQRQPRAGDYRVSDLGWQRLIGAITTAKVRAMKLRIEKAACVGNARCAAVSEVLFPLDEDGYIASEGFIVSEGDERIARNGAKACPERIIFVIEDDGSTSWPPGN
jgi:ferredoxin